MGKCLSKFCSKNQRAVANDHWIGRSSYSGILTEFEDTCMKKGYSDLESQIPFLERVAKHYEAEENWASLLRAHALYNSCLVRCQRNMNAEKQIEQIQKRYWSLNGITTPSVSRLRDMTASLKDELKFIRSKYKHELKRFEKNFSELSSDPKELLSDHNRDIYEQILQGIPELSRRLNKEMVDFSRLIAQYAEEICGTAPCLFSVVSMGSLGKCETTPYSDLEFMILVETKDNTTPYFEALAVTMYFLIGNLGETKLKYMAIPELSWFEDKAVSGFKIDGLSDEAGNIPTGNGKPSQRNHLICTVDELVKKYQDIRDNPDEESSLRGDLTAMLASTVHIYGTESFHKRLRSAIACHESNSRRKAADMEMLKEDIAKYDFQPTKELTLTRNVKADIYRYPSLLIFDLKLIHGIQIADSWEALEELRQKNFLSDDAPQCLNFSLCCGVYMRLATYFHHGSQKEAITVLESDSTDKNRPWLIPRTLLTHLFMNLIPLKAAINDYVSDLNQQTPAVKAALTDRSGMEALALVNYYCRDHQSVISTLKIAYPNNTLEMASSYFQWMFASSAVEIADYEMAECILKPKINSGQAGSYDFGLMGHVHQAQGQYDEALNCYEQARTSMNKHHDGQGDQEQRDSDIATLYDNTGAVLNSQGKHEDALAAHKKALQKRLDLFGENHMDVSVSYNNIGSVSYRRKRFKSAQKHYKKALALREALFGKNSYHMDIATSYSNIGCVLCELDSCDQALQHHEKALDIRKRLLGEGDHKDIATSYNNIGTVYYKQGYHEQAIEKYKMALNMRMRILKKGHPDIKEVRENIRAAKEAMDGSVTE